MGALNLNVDRNNEYALTKEAVNPYRKAKEPKKEVEMPRNKHGAVKVSNLTPELKEIHERVSQRAEEIREDITEKYEALADVGNVGVAEVQIPGVSSEVKAFSAFNNILSLRNPRTTSEEGFAEQVDVEGRAFDTLVINSSQKVDFVRGWNRSVCTESKIMEEIAKQLGDNRTAIGTINLFTEDNPCKSCMMVVGQFTKKYPNIKVQIFSEKQYYDKF